MIKNIRNNRITNCLLVLITLLYGVGCISEKLVEGGRWGLGFPFAMADRFFTGGEIYSSIQDGFKATTSYFPFMTYLGIVVRYVFKNYSELAAIIIAYLFFIGVLSVYSYIFAHNKDGFRLAYLVGLLIVITEFDTLKYYFLEWHPDIYSAFFASLASIYLLRILNKSNESKVIIYELCFVLLMYLCGIAKQNGVMYFVGFFIYTLLNKKECGKISIIKTALLEIVAGILVIANVVFLNGCWEACITVNSLHKKMSLKEFAGYLLNSVWETWFFCMLLLLFVYYVLKKKIVLNEGQKLWLCGSMAWCAFSIYGSFKEGANVGNIEAAIFPLMPFCMMAISKLSCGFGEKWSAIIKYVIVCLLGLFVAKSIYAVPTNIAAYNERSNNSAEVVEWLNNKYKGKKAAIWCHDYMMYSNANIEFSTDFYTVLVYYMAGLYSDDELSEYGKNEDWDIILMTDSDEIKYKYKKTLSYYRLVKDDAMPELLKGKLYERR